MRRVILEYSTLINGENLSIEMHLPDKLEKNLGSDDIVGVSIEEAKKEFNEILWYS